MAQIHNSELTRELTEGAKLQVSRDIVPNQLAEKVVPVMETNPKLLRRVNKILRAAKASTGSSSLYTVPTGKKFCITGISNSITANAACDVTAYTMQTTLGGATAFLVDFRKETTTAGSFTWFQTFTIPIEIEAGVSISTSMTLTAGASTWAYIVYGYEIDNALA